MYNDQGPIPVKLLARDEAVNVTIGLRLIRTSPDHGTAFDIARKNTANPGSMIEAIQLAIDFAARRGPHDPDSSSRGRRSQHANDLVRAGRQAAAIGAP